MLVLAQAAGPFTGMGLGWGGGLRLGWTFARRWIDRGETSGRPGIALELTETRADADAGPDVGSVRASTWSAALRATFTLRRGRTSLDLGAGGRFGLARLSGTPADATRTRGGTLAGTWAGPVAYAGVGVHAAPGPDRGRRRGGAGAPLGRRAGRRRHAGVDRRALARRHAGGGVGAVSARRAPRRSRRTSARAVGDSPAFLRLSAAATPRAGSSRPSTPARRPAPPCASTRSCSAPSPPAPSGPRAPAAIPRSASTSPTPRARA